MTKKIAPQVEEDEDSTIKHAINHHLIVILSLIINLSSEQIKV